MSRLTDDQVIDALREAEERLASGSTTDPAVDQVNPSQQDVQRQPPLPEPREKLSLRQPQKSTASTKEGAGANWFNLPKTELTPELKRDWQILRMRNVLDPKHQRKTLRANPPEYSQVGEIIAGPTDFYSARLTRKERKQTLFQEALSERHDTKLRAKSADIRRNKTSGKKAFYQRLVSQRRKQKG